MLIEFSVANFRSFCERQTLSLVKAKGNELRDSNTFVAKASSDIELLRSAVIYGPNAAGKSNFIRAVRIMQLIVMGSASRMQRNSKLPVSPFRLNKDAVNNPSEFEATFIIDSIRYQYGFSVTEDRVHEEWLFAYPYGRPQRWFERTWASEKREYIWDFGKNLSGEKQLWQNATRDNALLLSTAIQLNSRQLQPIYDWFGQTLHVTNLHGWEAGFTASLCENGNKEKVLNFLHTADINIKDIEIKTERFDRNELPDDMPDEIKIVLERDLQDKDIVDINIVHETIDGRSIPFEFEEESDGTQKLFAFAGPWIDSLGKGNILFVDELHSNLHPNLVRFLVELFNNNKTNPNNAQLVFTTHETSILSQDLFRRDQVWFCERHRDLSTKLYSLTDFMPRKGRENLELAYFSGRYGALPFIGSFREWGSHNGE